MLSPRNGPSQDGKYHGRIGVKVVRSAAAVRMKQAKQTQRNARKRSKMADIF
jgi:hypothetical protein